MAVRLLQLFSLAAAALCAASFRAQTSKERPVMKVVRLLQDMEAELQASLDDDRAVHGKLSCWCEENEKEKTQAIELGVQKSALLQSKMDEATARILELKAQRKATMDELYGDQKALGTATELRMKENQAFHKDETFLLDAINAAKQAIVVLSAHHPELAQLRTAIQPFKDARVARFLSSSASLRGSQLDALKDFVEKANSVSSFMAIPGFQSYAPQSGQIFGILKQMQADFERSLSEAQKAEAKAVAEFESLRAAKQSQIAAAQKAVAEMDRELADTAEKHAQAAQEFEDTQAQLELDRTFLANLKTKCSESEEEFNARVKSRLEEIAAVKDTIKILNNDKAFDNFDKTVNVALLQTNSEQLRQRAARVLQRAAGAAPRLALLATSLQLDSFAKVKEAIDTMVTELDEQQADETTHRDWCIAELNSNTRDTAAAEDTKEGLRVRIADLEKAIEDMTADIESTEAAMAESQKQMARASETREAENADFQQTVMDHRLTQVVLNKALIRMRKVYALLQEPEDQPGAAHTMTSATHTDPGNGPARFTKYEQHASGSRVVQLLKDILADSKKIEDEAITAEEDSQFAYESFMQDSNKELEASIKKVSNLSAARASAKQGLSMAKTDLSQTVQELGDLSLTAGNLHKNCDFVLKNFDARQAARAAEVKALKEAKAILSGMQ